MALAGMKILIVGGGFSGMATAMACARRGARVDLVEIDGGWRSYGAGISLGGATLRAFRELGILDAFLARGFAGDGLSLFDPAGGLIVRLPTPRVAGPDVPGSGGVMRPVLAKLMADATLAAGTNVRLGCSFSGLDEDADGITAEFTDRTSGRYDLVVGADGLFSQTRKLIFPESPVPRYSGQAVWRAVLPRPPQVTGAAMWEGGKVKPGVNPVSRDQMYLFLTENRPHNAWVDPAELADLLRALLAPFPDPLLQSLRDQLGPDSHIIFRPLEGLLMREPWYRGRLVLVGDAVHATTPHLASGACIGIEDGIVLAEELERHPTVAQAQAAFFQRRWERCRMVVENSWRLGEMEIHGGDKAEYNAIIGRSMAALAEPI